MTNKKYVDRFEQAGIIIHKMFWIAGSYESEDLKEMLMEIDGGAYERLIPDFNIESLESYLDDETPVQLFADNDLWGFIAETRYPNRYDFKYNKKGEVFGYSILQGVQTIDYVYGETIEELCKSIEKKAEENYRRCLVKDQKKAKSKAKF